MAFNKSLFTTDGGQAKTGVSFQKFTYLDKNDGQTVIEGAGYFNDVKDRLNDSDIIQVLDETRSPAGYYALKVKDQGGLHNDLETELVSSGGGGGAGGDVVGPVLSVKDNISTFADATGKLIKDSGVAIGTIAEAKQIADDSKVAADAAELTANNAAQQVQDFYTMFANLKAWDNTTTYKEGEFATVTNNPWHMIIVSKSNNNTNNQPPATPDEANANWTVFDYSHIGTDEYFAKFKEVRFAGDGTKKTFNITQELPGFEPESDDNSVGVFVNNLIVSKIDYNISKDANGNSLITFSVAPPAPASQDPDAFNIIINAGQAKQIEVLHAVPLGAGMIFSIPSLPQGWLELNGQTISSTTYPELVELLNPGQPTATLKDLRVENLKGEIRAIKAFDAINNSGSIDLNGLAQDVSNNTSVISGMQSNKYKYELFYGGRFDASKQFTPIASPIYNYPGYKYTFNGSTQYLILDTTGVNISSNDFIFHQRFDLASIARNNGIFNQYSNDEENINMNIESDSRMFMSLSSNGVSNDIFSGYTVKKFNDITALYDIRLWYDLSATAWKFDWSDDKLDIDNDSKVWNNEHTIVTSLMIKNPIVKTYTLGASFYSTDTFLNGSIYLDNTSWFVDGKQLIRRQDIPYIINDIAFNGTVRDEDNTVDLISVGDITTTRPAATPYAKWYPFVGFDNNADKNVIIEFATDSTGTGLSLITGAKRLLDDVEYIPNDGAGDLAEFIYSKGRFRVELWSGSLGVGTATLSDDFNNYNLLYFQGLDNGGTVDVRPTEMFYLNLTNRVLLYNGSAFADVIPTSGTSLSKTGTATLGRIKGER